MTAAAFDPGLPGLVDSWELDLKAHRKAERTLDTYIKNVRTYFRWCEDVAGDVPVLSRRQVVAFLAWMNDQDKEASTMRARLTALKSFAKWCAKEGELPGDEVTGIQPAALGEKDRPIVTDAQFEALVKACDSKTFKGKRDSAILHFLRDSGARSDEILSMVVAEISLRDRQALIHGKGARDRWVAFGPDTAAAVDRYLRARRTHELAETGRLWLGDRNQSFTYTALWKMITKRCERLEIGHLHPHMFRRMFADEWLTKGGSADGLMALAGWRDPQMIKHYAGARANARALDEHKRLYGGA